MDKVEPRKRLLVVSPTFPYPLVSGGKQRVFYVLRELARRFDITLLSLAEVGDDTPAARDALSFLSALETVPIRQNRLAQLLRVGLRIPQWLLGAPAEVLVKRTPALDAAYTAMLMSGDFDAVLIEYSQLLHLVTPAKDVGLLVAVTAHDVSFVSQQRKAEVSSGFWRWFWMREARLMKAHEMRGWRRADLVFAMSDTDRQQIQGLLPEVQVHSMPNGVDTPSLQPLPESAEPSLIFVGWMRHFPNQDAVRWLFSDIWPLIRQGHPQVRLKLAGGGLPDDLQRVAAQDERVEYLGFVDDIAAAVGSATLSLVPIRVGSGSRLKILESMALATPVVSTRVGSEGIAATDGEHLVLADRPEEFADAVINLLGDQARRQALAERARSLVEEVYDWRAIGENGAGLLARLMERRP